MAIKYDADPDLASRIIRCESGNKPEALGYNYRKRVIGQDKDGNDIFETYLSSIDYSFWQINSIHAKEAWKYGLDITNPLDNLEYGFILLSEEGVAPWSASQACWTKS